MSALPAQRLASSAPSGSDTLAVRRRYLRRRRTGDRGWITLWVTLAALIGWLLIAGFSLLGH